MIQIGVFRFGSDQDWNVAVIFLPKPPKILEGCVSLHLVPDITNALPSCNAQMLQWDRCSRFRDGPELSVLALMWIAHESLLRPG